MKCPFQDIGCLYIDDVTHECEAKTARDCRHEWDCAPEDEENGKRQY